MSYGAIYKITNKLDGKCYIGKSINPKERIRVHTKRFCRLTMSDYVRALIRDDLIKKKIIKEDDE